MKDKSIGTIFKNIGWLVFDRVFILGMNMVVIFIIANFYGPEKYGLYQYAVNLVLVLEIIVQLVDGRVVKRRYDTESYDQVVFNVTTTKVLLSCVALGFGSMIMAVSNRGTDFSIMLFFLMIDSIVKNLRFGMENRFEYFFQSKRVVIASNVGLFIGTLLQLGAVSAKLSIIYIAAIQVIATSISLGVLYFQYIREFESRSKGTVDKSFVCGIIKESLPLAIASAACVIYTRCDSIMLGLLLSTTEVGIYSISSKLTSTVQILIVPIQTTVFIKMIEWYKEPKKYETDVSNTDSRSIASTAVVGPPTTDMQGQGKYERNYLRITSLATWISILGILCSFVVLPFLFKLFKPEYFPALDAYKILSVGTIFTYNAILRSSHFTITQNGKILMITQLITVAANIILNYVLINLYGMNGAAVATVIAQFISLFLSNLFYKDARFVFKNQIKAFNPIYIFKSNYAP